MCGHIVESTTNKRVPLMEPVPAAATPDPPDVEGAAVIVQQQKEVIASGCLLSML